MIAKRSWAVADRGEPYCTGRKGDPYGIGTAGDAYLRRRSDAAATPAGSHEEFCSK